MKKSTQILLTLFVPTVTTLGCYNQNSTVTRSQSNCSTPANPGEPPKTPCDPNQANNQRVNHRGSSFVFLPWGGWGRSSAPAVAPSQGVQANSSNMSSPSNLAPGSKAAPSSVSRGGFGRTGSAFSSGS